jgi:hypothetical protein
MSLAFIQTTNRRRALGVLGVLGATALFADSAAQDTAAKRRKKRRRRRRSDTSDPEMWVDVQPDQVWNDLDSSTQFASERHVVDLSNFTEIKLMALVRTAGTGMLRIDWEINPSQNDFATLVGSIDLSTTGVKQTDYVSIPSEARGLINIVAAAAGGSGKDNSPETRGVAVMVR